MTPKLLIVTTLAIYTDYCMSGHVLFIPPMVSSSHKIAMVVWAEALQKRGHHVHWFAPAPKLDDYQPKGVGRVDHFRVVDNADDQSLMDNFVHENSTGLRFLTWRLQFNVPFIDTLVTYMLTPYCQSILTNRNKRTLFENLIRTRFDLIILDELFNPCGYLLLVNRVKFSLNYSTPVITYLSTCKPTRKSFGENGVPTPASYVSHIGSLSVLTDRLSFYHRLQTFVTNVVGHVIDSALYRLITYRLAADLHIKSGMIRPDFQFLCQPMSLGFPQPITNNVVFVGGMQIPYGIDQDQNVDAPDLDETFQRIIAQSASPNSNGFILFAMGHYANNFHYAPESIKSAFHHAFNEMARRNYTVVWQYRGPSVENLHRNVHLSKWVPQKALLAHPACKLFVTHAGCNSLTEALYYGAPMVAIPLFADQGDGAARILKHGFGTVVRKNNISALVLIEAMTEVLTNSRYAKNVKKFSRQFKSEIRSPLDRAVHWSEFVMRHGQSVNAPNFYKTNRFATDHTWFKIYNIDIIAILILVFVTVICVVVKLTVFICIRIS